MKTAGAVRNLQESSLKNRVPLTVHLELTHNCSLDCLHCFHRGHRNLPGEELGGDEIKKLLDSLKAANSVFLVLTGGEPLARPDIFEILEYAAGAGFALILFTNGTLIDADTAARLAEFSFFDIHISIYSSEPEAHDRITRVKGSFKKAAEGIEFLTGRGIRPVIKTPVMKENFRDIEKLRGWAKEKGLLLKADPVITPCHAGNSADIIRRRISLEQVNEAVFEWGIFDVGDFRPRRELECAAGRSLACIDSAGRVFPCIAWRREKGNISKEKFSRIWERMKTDYSGIASCRECGLLPYCGVCPGIASVEGKDFFCRTAESLESELKNCDKDHGKLL